MAYPRPGSWPPPFPPLSASPQHFPVRASGAHGSPLLPTPHLVTPHLNNNNNNQRSLTSATITPAFNPHQVRPRGPANRGGVGHGIGRGIAKQQPNHSALWFPHTAFEDPWRHLVAKRKHEAECGASVNSLGIPSVQAELADSLGAGDSLGSVHNPVGEESSVRDSKGAVLVHSASLGACVFGRPSANDRAPPPPLSVIEVPKKSKPNMYLFDSSAICENL